MSSRTDVMDGWVGDRKELPKSDDWSSKVGLKKAPMEPSTQKTPGSFRAFFWSRARFLCTSIPGGKVRDGREEM